MAVSTNFRLLGSGGEEEEATQITFYRAQNHYSESKMNRVPRIRQSLTISTSFVALLLLSFSGSISAQSGRRASKPQPTPSSAAGSTIEEKTKVETDTSTKPFGSLQLNSPVKLLIARQLTSKHLPSEDAISASFVKRLNECTSLTATPVGDLKRDGAVRRAQAETDSFVVFLQFDIDSFQGGTVILNSQSLEVKYSVFAPRTGKQRAKGKVYYQPIGSGRMRKSDWPNGTPIKITSEAAGIEAAEQLYYSLVMIVGAKQNR